MAEKNIRDNLVDALSDLGERDLKRFGIKLCDRSEEPRIRRNMVENKDDMDIADVLVRTFTEKSALTVAVQIMKSINRNDVADELLKTQQTSAGGRSPSGSTSAYMVGDKHFVDHHKVALIARVSNVNPILDELLSGGVIQDETYSELLGLSTSQKKMRELFIGPLNSCGIRGKDVFYEILKNKEKYLIDELKEK